MFENHADSKVITYQSPTCDHVPLPNWNSPKKKSGKRVGIGEEGSTVTQIEPENITSEPKQLLAPSNSVRTEASQPTKEDVSEPENDDNHLLNHEPDNDHVGVDVEGLYNDNEKGAEQVPDRKIDPSTESDFDYEDSSSEEDENILGHSTFFCIASRLKTNLQKSNVLPIRCGDHDLEIIHQLLP
jgi:hypothetical protein